MSNKVALITGVTGQDGAYLSELLLEQGYTVHGIKRRSSLFNTARVDHLVRDPREPGVRFFMHHGDMTDSSNLMRIIQDVEPTEIYNMAAQSHVAVSFEMPEYTANADALGTLRLLEAIRVLRRIDKTRFYQASTSELYGLVQETPQKETTPFYPRSPYAAAKLYSYWVTIGYREAYNYYACNGILFNHESPVRGETFVTRKITRILARICLGLDRKLLLGNLAAERDWGHAADYVRAAWLMLQQDAADDYVVATGRSVSVRDFARKAFSTVGLRLTFEGAGAEEVGRIDAIDSDRFEAATGGAPQHLQLGQEVVAVDPSYFRPTEVDKLIGDAGKARRKLGWEPTHTLEEMIEEMVANDMRLARRERAAAVADADLEGALFNKKVLVPHAREGDRTSASPSAS